MPRRTSLPPHDKYSPLPSPPTRRQKEKGRGRIFPSGFKPFVCVSLNVIRRHPGSFHCSRNPYGFPSSPSPLSPELCRLQLPPVPSQTFPSSNFLPSPHRPSRTSCRRLERSSLSRPNHHGVSPRPPLSHTYAPVDPNQPSNIIRPPSEPSSTTTCHPPGTSSPRHPPAIERHLVEMEQHLAFLPGQRDKRKQTAEKYLEEWGRKWGDELGGNGGEYVRVVRRRS